MFPQELESQRAAACEEGQHSREDLLWKLDQTNKELDSAKKVGLVGIEPLLLMKIFKYLGF